ncbi:trimeric intracellular cation channel family protein [Aerolutibacter ruishenii]|uniref:Putative membrane protein YeiH n=1 Tax=Aerolutibacter ruishenii TaxID=686800 RepID=A0A562LCN5_9GAMM|nr:TRIC cation channel family protein [Lysobacter ruishenii]TWI05390.1 putative membrane protein YeiH [Lysobacter ruishenii]
MTEQQVVTELHRTLVLCLDLGGTFAFALSGAMVGIRRRLDLFGVLLLAYAASTAGGVGRDVMIDTVPPVALRDWRYLAVSVAAGGLAFFCTGVVKKLRDPVRVMDAVGLAFFAVAGTQKALLYGAGPLGAALLGMMTGIGGGIVRDVLVREIPAVLRSEFYAIAALAGAACVVAGGLLRVPVLASAVVGGVVCFGLRMIGIRRGWQLPVAGTPH